MRKAIVLVLAALVLSPASATPLKLRVITKDASLKAAPDVVAITLARLPLDTVLQAEAKLGEWYRVTIETEDGRGLAGYIHELLVAPIEAGDAPATRAGAEEEWDNIIQAQGGRAALEAVKDSTLYGTYEVIPLAQNGRIKMCMKEPDKMRVDIDFMGRSFSQGYDGLKAWQNDYQAGGVRELDARGTADFRRQALGNDAQLNPAKWGVTYVLKPKERILDKDYLVLEQGYQDGEKVTFYVDPATHFVYKSRAMTTDEKGAEVESETILSDHRKAGGLTIAHVLTVIQNGKESVRITYTKIEHNTGIDDSTFKIPK